MRNILKHGLLFLVAFVMNLLFIIGFWIQEPKFITLILFIYIELFSIQMLVKLISGHSATLSAVKGFDLVVNMIMDYGLTLFIDFILMTSFLQAVVLAGNTFMPNIKTLKALNLLLTTEQGIGVMLGMLIALFVWYLVRNAMQEILNQFITKLLRPMYNHITRGLAHDQQMA